jgi:hypothetical protein
MHMCAQAERTLAAARSPKKKNKGALSATATALAEALKKAKSGGGAKGGGGKGQKDCFEPNQAQLGEMLEGMLVMETLGLDEVVDAPPAEDGDEEDEEEDEDQDYEVRGSVSVRDWRLHQEPLPRPK